MYGHTHVHIMDDSNQLQVGGNNLKVSIHRLRRITTFAQCTQHESHGPCIEFTVF